MTNPVEMASDDRRITATLRAIPEYVELFRKAFPADKQPATFANAARAIGAFERQLLTPSRFDRFLSGDASALTEPEKAGLVLFAKAGCISCHDGAFLGGSALQKLGKVVAYPDTSDAGREGVTKLEADRELFKVPSLRNSARTGPYFHNGKLSSLDEAIRQMAHYQLGRDLAPADIASIVAFLGSLTGEIPPALVAEPTLPKSTAAVPRPDPK